MLKKSYRIFLISGMAVGVITGIFFLCSFQSHITDNAVAKEVRQTMEQSAILYQAPKETPENTILALHSMSLSECEKAMEAIPPSWQYSPMAQPFGHIPTVSAGGIVLTDVEILYSTENFFTIREMEISKKGIENSLNSCFVSQAFLDSHGWSLSEVPKLVVDGQPKEITAVFQATQATSETELPLLSLNSSLLLVLPYETATDEHIEVPYILIKKPETLPLSDFEAELAKIEQTLNLKYEGGENIFQARTSSAFQKTVSSSGSAEAFSLLGTLFLAFLGELLAGINLMSLASAGILESRQRTGIKLAIGATYRSLFFELLKETLCVCAKGTLLGMAISAVLVYYTNKFLGSFLFLFNWHTVLAAVCIMTLVCFISSYFPFRQILKQEPAVLLKKE